MNIEGILKEYTKYKTSVEGKSQKTMDDYFRRLKKFFDYNIQIL